MKLIDLHELFPRVKFYVGVEVDKIPLLTGKIFLHRPSYIANKKYFDELKFSQNRRRYKGKKLKVVVVSPIYGGSLPIAEYTQRAFKELGHDVVYIDNGVFYPVYKEVDTKLYNEEFAHIVHLRFAKFLEELVVARCIEARPDIVIAVAQAPIGKEGYKKLRGAGIPTAFWFVEDYLLMNYWRSIVKFVDYFFVIQKENEFITQLREIGIKNYHYLPCGCDPSIHRKLRLTKKEKEEYGSDVSFVGAGYYNRRNVFVNLLDFDFKIWGTDWDMDSPLRKIIQRNGARLSPEEYIKVFNATKININLHSSVNHPTINPDGDYLNPRTFELASACAFQLVDERKYLHELFDKDEIVKLFTNQAEEN